MADQAEIHRDVVSGKVKERIGAVGQLRSDFADLPDREQAWNDLIRLTLDKDRGVRRNAADALGSAFSHIPDKEQAWNDLHRLTHDKGSYARSGAAGAIGHAFPHIPDKEQAWNDLHRLTHDKNSGVRLRVADALGTAFPHVLDKKQAWEDLHRLTPDKDCGVRRNAADALGSAFSHVPDKEEACGDLHWLTHDRNIGVRLRVADALGTAFPHVLYKKQAWEDLHRLTQDKNRDVQLRAVDALGNAFQHVPDKKRAWDDLHRMTQDTDKYVQRSAVTALGTAFPHVPDKKQGWKDIIRLMHDGDVRRRVKTMLGDVFPGIFDMEQAWKDLIELMQNKNVEVRRGAVYILGTAFPHVTDKEQVWEDLYRLTQDEDKVVQISVNHYLGRLSIVKATEAESEESFRNKLQEALRFFEEASRGGVLFDNPSSFCLPFYRSFYAITYEKEKEKAEDEVKKYLAEAKSASENSEGKKTLIEAVENLAKALSETQSLREAKLDTIQHNLNTYRQHCDRAVDLIDAAEVGAPGAARVLRRGLPIIDNRIKELLEEIKTKAEIICETPDHPESELGCRIEQDTASALVTDNPVIVDRLINHILSGLERWSRSIPDENKREYVQESISDTHKDMVSKLLTIDSLMPMALTFSKEGGDRISQSIHSSTNSQKDLSQNNAEAPEPSEESKKKTVPFLSDLESEICDIFKSVYQKEREKDVGETNSKTLEFLKYKLLDLTASGKRIDWLDMGCGDGRSLDVLDAVQNRDNIRYHGIDSSYRYLDDTEKRARKYGLNVRLDKIDAAAMKFDSEYDVVSAVLLLHEVDPLCLPYILRNMLRALKGDGTLIIADFQGPYEQEEGVVTWGVEDIRNLLERIGGARMSIEFMPSSQYPDELGFYRCYVKKPGLDREKFSNLLQGYGNFLDAKKEESKRKRGELRSQIEERVRKLLNRPDIDLKNISEGEMQRIQTEIGDEYGIKAHKIRLLTSQIEFLDDKIKGFRSGVGCDGADQRAP